MPNRPERINVPLGLSAGSLVTKFSSDKLAFNEDYQRNDVWTTEQKRLLIDSIFKGYDIPKIYFHPRQDGEGNSFNDVVDGQQRIRSIVSFHDNEFALGEDGDDDLKGKKFRDLDDEDEHRFLEYQLSIIQLRGYEEDDIKDMFLRFQHGTSLNAAEKRHAIPGEMNGVVKRL